MKDGEERRGYIRRLRGGTLELTPDICCRRTCILLPLERIDAIRFEYPPHKWVKPWEL